jgi:alkanesulfonate monooxygenase SsuD/methylene tetrahydromethanopterin reductase-like flavin-dependent oxidoreductase (luciferase family)
MKVGIFQLLPGGYGRDAAQVCRDNLEMATEAEAMGFHAIWAAEHHFSEYGMVGDPLLYLSAVAGRTQRIRLGTGVVVVPVYEPVRLAENAAFVDVVSGGRLDLGVGRGYQPHEFVGFDVPQGEATDRTAEALELLRRLWTEEEVDFEGRFYRTHGARLVPRPLQTPHPPIWTAAVSPGTFSRAGAAGERILTSPNFTPIQTIKDNFNAYREALRANGFSPDDQDYPVMQQVYVGKDSRAAYEEPRVASME